MSHFPYPKGIYSVSWCDCSSVGAPSGHLSVPRCQRERRRLHQISREGEGEEKEESLIRAPVDSATRWTTQRRYWSGGDGDGDVLRRGDVEGRRGLRKRAS